MVRIACIAILASSLFGADSSTALRLAKTIPLEGLKGHFDHFGFDPKHGRLFATLQAEGVVEILSAKDGAPIGRINGVGKPHAVLYRADLNQLYITDGDHNHGNVHVVDGSSLKIVKTVALAPGAEQFGYDSQSRRMYVANGGHDAASEFGFLSVIDTDKGEKLADIRVETPNLEGVAAEVSGNRVFVNDRLHSQVVVIDKQKKTVTGQWPISDAKLNVALALDESAHRLFVGCRSGQIAVLDTGTGKQVTSLPIKQGVDDLFFDPKSGRIFAPAGASGGSLEIFHEDAPNRYSPVAAVSSAAEGKNGIYVPQLHRYFVGVPDHGSDPATILVFEVH